MEEYRDTLFEEFRQTKSDEFDSPEAIKDAFVKISNSLIGEQQIAGDLRELRIDDFSLEVTFDNIGYLVKQPSGSPPFRLGINVRWWDQAEPEGRYILLLHEMTHFIDESHEPNFWDSFAEFHIDAKDKYALIERIFENPFSWKAADWYLITMADIPNIDLEYETVPERRQKIADKLQYNDFEQFKLFSTRVSIQENEKTEFVDIESIDVEMPSNYEIHETMREWLNQDQSPMSIENEEYILDPPILEEYEDGRYTPVISKKKVGIILSIYEANESVEQIPAEIQSESDKPI